MVKIKRLFVDIETSPNIGFFWQSGFKLSIPYENIIHERKIICICYKWDGEKKVHSLTWDSKQNDRQMLDAFVKVLDQADEIVYHNGDRFDLPWIRTRCLIHGIDIRPDYSTFDTLKFARSKFRFNSNRLDYIAKFLGIGAKIGTSFSLWKEIVLNKCKKSLDAMVKYCCGDVTLLEQVYDKLLAYLPSKVHHGVLHEQGKLSCPSCASKELVRKGYLATAAGTIKVRLKCKSCSKSHSMTKATYEKLKDES